MGPSTCSMGEQSSLSWISEENVAELGMLHHEGSLDMDAK